MDKRQFTVEDLMALSTCVETELRALDVMALHGVAVQQQRAAACGLSAKIAALIVESAKEEAARKAAEKADAEKAAP